MVVLSLKLSPGFLKPGCAKMSPPPGRSTEASLHCRSRASKEASGRDLHYSSASAQPAFERANSSKRFARQKQLSSLGCTHLIRRAQLFGQRSLPHEKQSSPSPRVICSGRKPPPPRALSSQKLRVICAGNWQPEARAAQSRSLSRTVLQCSRQSADPARRAVLAEPASNEPPRIRDYFVAHPSKRLKFLRPKRSRMSGLHAAPKAANIRRRQKSPSRQTSQAFLHNVACRT